MGIRHPFNMAAGSSGSMWNDSQKDEIIRIVESVIKTITQLSNVAGRSNPAPVRASSGSSSSRSEIQLQVQDFLEVQGQYVLCCILLGDPLDDHVSHQPCQKM